MLNNDENLARSSHFFFQEEPPSSEDKMRFLSEANKFPKEDVVDTLNELLVKEADPKILMQIIKTMSKLNDKSCVGPLLDLLLLKDNKYRQNLKNTDEDEKIRCQIVKLLGIIKDKNAVNGLLYLLNSKNENYTIRLAVAEALGKIGDRYAVVSLIDIVSNEDEKSIYLRESAAKALGMLGDDRAVDPLISILETKKGILDKFTFLKERIIETLGRIGHKNDKILKVLSNALLDASPYVRLGAVEALSELDDERIISLLEPLIMDEEEDVARATIIALYNTAGENYIVKLQERVNLPGWCRDEIELILEDEEEYIEVDKYDEE